MTTPPPPEPRSAPADLTETEREMHGLFAALRASVIRLSTGFTQRVRGAVEADEAERLRSPPPRAVVGSFLAQLANLLAPRPGRDEDDE